MPCPTQKSFPRYKLRSCLVQSGDKRDRASLTLITPTYPHGDILSCTDKRAVSSSLTHSFAAAYMHINGKQSSVPAMPWRLLQSSMNNKSQYAQQCSPDMLQVLIHCSKHNDSYSLKVSLALVGSKYDAVFSSNCSTLQLAQHTSVG